jgi:CheY-like chemotaxis protein
VSLLVNASQAISASLDDPETPRRHHVVRIESRVEAGHVVLRVKDTGKGIERGALSSIFDPFAYAPSSAGTPLKAGGETMSLRLAHAYDVVQRLGGDIRVESSPTEGSSFEVTIPMDPHETESLSPSTARQYTFEKRGSNKAFRAASPLGEAVSHVDVRSPAAEFRPRILIIDDEAALGKALARQLSNRYDVDTACTANDALSQFVLHFYEAVICDVLLTDQSGPAIFEQIARQAPLQAERFIFTTGGGYGDEDDRLYEAARNTGRPILEKPFAGTAFEAMVDAVAFRRPPA